jgi:hypothetical protein
MEGFWVRDKCRIIEAVSDAFESALMCYVHVPFAVPLAHYLLEIGELYKLAVNGDEIILANHPPNLLSPLSDICR